MHFSLLTAISIFTYLNMVSAEDNSQPKSKEALPDEFKQPGVVLILSRKCKHSKKLLEFVTTNNIPHKEIFLDDDEKARDFIMKNYNSKVPWVFQDGNLVGDGYAFMNKYETEKKNLPSQTNQNMGSNLSGMDDVRIKTSE
jgi:glutaredoxin